MTKVKIETTRADLNEVWSKLGNSDATTLRFNRAPIARVFADLQRMIGAAENSGIELNYVNDKEDGNG